MVPATSAFYVEALKLLERRDYTVIELRKKLDAKLGPVPDDVIALLIQKKFLNDRRFTENYASKRKDRGVARLREELTARGVEASLTEEILSSMDWPSLKSALTAKMTDLKLRVPLHPRDAARLFRALVRLGYDEDAIREEVELLHEQ